MPDEAISPKPTIIVRPLPHGRCSVELHAIVDWETAIEIMKALGHLGEVAAIEQEFSLPHRNGTKNQYGAANNGEAI